MLLCEPALDVVLCLIERYLLFGIELVNRVPDRIRENLGNFSGIKRENFRLLRRRQASTSTRSELCTGRRCRVLQLFIRSLFDLLRVLPGDKLLVRLIGYGLGIGCRRLLLYPSGWRARITWNEDTSQR